MSRHKGRRRFSRRTIWPKHCACDRPHGWAAGRSWVEFHTVRTSAPLIPPHWKLRLPR